MRPHFTEQLDAIARQSIPFAVTMLLVIVGTLQVPVPHYGTIAPAAALMAVYYWTIYRGDLMPAVAVFTIGFLHDNLAGTPLGLSSLVLLLAYALIRSQRRYLQDKSFVLHWAGFLVFAVAVGLGKWLAMTVLYGLFIDIRPTLFQLAVELALYPCMAWLMLKTQNAFLQQV